MKSKIFTIVLSGFLQLFPGTGFSQENAAGNTSSLQKIPVVYPRQRLWPSPSGGLAAEFNPPVLLWPSNQKMTWNVRMSQDPEFKNENSVHAENLKWAMFNPHKKLASGNWYWQYKTKMGDWSKTASFVINDESRELVSPEIITLTSKIPDGHPRILSLKEDLIQLRSLKGLPDAKTIIDEANEFLRNDIPEESEGYSKRKVDSESQQRKLDQDASLNLSTAVFEEINKMVLDTLKNTKDNYIKRLY